MTKETLIVKANELIDKHPSLQPQIRDFIELAFSEIEDGESETHECELAWNDILELTGENIPRKTYYI